MHNPNLQSSPLSQTLPNPSQLETMLNLPEGNAVVDLVVDRLINPLASFLGRPGKRIRGHLVELGFMLAGRFGSNSLTEQEEAICGQAARVVEALHAGSLVVDDIEDGSRLRRGEPTLHELHGVPVALNAGNWLYFWPLERVAHWKLEPSIELRIYRLCHQTLLRAHFGQSIDVGVGIDTLPQSRIPQVCLSALELKTGALMALGLNLGATLAGADEERIATLNRFGHHFGIALQMFDDLGNLRGEKKYEDLRLRRPSWVWAVVASRVPPESFENFKRAISSLPDDEPLIQFFDEHAILADARDEAVRYLDAALSDLRRALEGQGEYEDALFMLGDWVKKLKVAYE